MQNEPLSPPGVAAGMLLCFIPITGEFVIPRSARRFRDRDDRADAVDGILRQQGDWPVASAIAVALLSLLLVPMLFYERLQQRVARREGADGQESICFQRRRGRAVALGLASICRSSSWSSTRSTARAWSRSGAAGRSLVSRAAQRSRHDGCRLDQPAHRRAVGERRHHARHLRRHRAHAIRAFPRPPAVFRHGLRAAGDAGSDHGARRCCCCSSRSMSTAASDDLDRPTPR